MDNCITQNHRFFNQLKGFIADTTIVTSLVGLTMDGTDSYSIYVDRITGDAYVRHTDNCYYSYKSVQEAVDAYKEMGYQISWDMRGKEGYKDPDPSTKATTSKDTPESDSEHDTKEEQAFNELVDNAQQDIAEGATKDVDDFLVELDTEAPESHTDDTKEAGKALTYKDLDEGLKDSIEARMAILEKLLVMRLSFIGGKRVGLSHMVITREAVSTSKAMRVVYERKDLGLRVKASHKTTQSVFEVYIDDELTLQGRIYRDGRISFK